MFNNIGKKIKTLAVVICWIGIVGSVLAGIIMCVSDEDMIIFGLLTMIAGALISWIGSFFMYGFGELIDKTAEIAANTRKEQPAPMFYGAPMNHMPPMGNNVPPMSNNVPPMGNNVPPMEGNNNVPPQD